MTCITQDLASIFIYQWDNLITSDRQCAIYSPQNRAYPWKCLAAVSLGARKYYWF